MSGPARRSTARRWSAATPSTSPTASCRCCRSGISNDLCSLRPGENRPCARRAHGARPPTGASCATASTACLMRSAAKLAYQQAQAAIDGQPDDTTGPLLEHVLKPLWAAYRCARKAPRRARRRWISTCPSARSCCSQDGTVDRVVAAAAARCAPADRGVHDPRQRRGRRDAGGEEDRRCSTASTTSPRWRSCGRSREFLATIDIKLTAPGRAAAGRSSTASWTARRRRRARSASINEVVLRTPGAGRVRRRELSAISASTCAATRISPRRSAAMPT